MKKTILVTGGAGYIGTNVVDCLVEKGHKVIVVDNFSNSHHKYIQSLKNRFPEHIDLFEMDILDEQKLDFVFSTCKIHAVIHLAGKKYIPESFEKEDEYYLNNITATEILLRLMSKHKVKRLVFSSSITVYGNKEQLSIEETSLHDPISPYAQQKALGEKMIYDWAKQTGNTAIVLRLSNPIGANAELKLGEDSTSGRKGLLPYLIDCATENKKIVLNGNTHPTRDGTTVRDYVHVMDVASAFVKAVEKTLNKPFDVFNIGTGGNGISVLDVLKQVERSVNKKMDYSFGPNRQGDISVIVSNVDKAEKVLKFKATKTLKDMVESQHLFQINQNKR